ncbi:uncharacterized protein KQ657_004060 [Scheffersomyces spartinae]|uniref:Uncharacterized protein n=1 Tax=Scheffersomyces spartinae TaxID=45513 RepID=A0A9P7VC12_9ASCO|nr:uncharacterized protein KQ657_004060 [Scheffersomyces spartinae]KAG7194950.1 hypothetical protein KQ657_004060 [Scheffersomyces spartinae]
MAIKYNTPEFLQGFVLENTVLIAGFSLTNGIIAATAFVRDTISGPHVLAFSIIHLMSVSTGTVHTKVSDMKYMLVVFPVVLMLNSIASTMFFTLKLLQLYSDWLVQHQNSDLENQAHDVISTRHSINSTIKNDQLGQSPIVTKKVSEKTLVNEYPTNTIFHYNTTYAIGPQFTSAPALEPPPPPPVSDPNTQSINFDSNKSTLVGTTSSNGTSTQLNRISYQSANLLFAEKTPASSTSSSSENNDTHEPFKGDTHYNSSQLTVPSCLPKVRKKSSDIINTPILSPNRAQIVHKSKSTSVISEADAATAKERNFVISNEKVLLLNINESLLPPLLRHGESPILERQRQQKEYELLSQTQVKAKAQTQSERLQQTQSQRLVSRDERLSKYTQSKSFTDKQTTISKSELSRILESHNLSDSENIPLPYIEEFGGCNSSLDQEEAFASFDGSYASQDQKIDCEQGSPLQNKSRNVLSGLETVQGYSQWDPSTLAHKKDNIKGNVNHISLGDWLQKSDQWNQRRVGSGVRIASFPLQDATGKQLPKAYTYDDLMLDDGQRNITSYFQRSSQAEEYVPNGSFDKIFDVTIGLDNDQDQDSVNDKQQREVFPNTVLDRTTSAPSLHTFRKPSNTEESSTNSYGTRYSEGADVDRSLKLTEIDIHTGDEAEQQPETPKPSPIKRFFQESPRKLSSVFKRNSRTSFDGSFMYPRHKHTGSTVSNQFSMNSTASSRSLPKKSLKSMLTHKALLLLQRPEVSSRRNSQSQAFRKRAFDTHQSHNSVPNFSSFHLDSGMVDHYFTKFSSPGFSSDQLEAWDINMVPDSDNSRVLSVPSAVIGQYDREKWRTLKELETINQHRTISSNLST